MVDQEARDANMQAKLMQHDHVKVTSMPNAIKPRQACKMRHGRSSMQGEHVTACEDRQACNNMLDNLTRDAYQMQYHLNMQQHVNRPSMQQHVMD